MVNHLIKFLFFTFSAVILPAVVFYVLVQKLQAGNVSNINSEFEAQADTAGVTGEGTYYAQGCQGTEGCCNN
jgi:hypothetical protein